MTAPAFPPLHGAEEGDQIYLRAGHTTAQLQLQVRRGQETWQGELREDGWHLYPVGGRVDGQPYGVVRCGQDGTLWVKLTGLQVLPLAPGSDTQKRKDAPRQEPAQRRQQGPAQQPARGREAAGPPTYRPPEHRTTYAQPARERGWPDRVRAVRTWGDVLSLVDEMGARIPSAAARAAVQDLLVDHLARGLLWRASADQICRFEELASRLEPAPAAALALAVGAHRAGLGQERDPLFQGGEERLDVE